MLGLDTVFGILVPDDEEHHIKSVVFRDEEENSFGPFTKMSSTMDDVNLKTINFPIGLRPPFDEVSEMLASVDQWGLSDQSQLTNEVSPSYEARATIITVS